MRRAWARVAAGRSDTAGVLSFFPPGRGVQPYGQDPDRDRTVDDGRTIPAIGPGTAPMDDERSRTAVADALRIGYRLIDTGAAYGNETGVGRGIADSGVPREEISVVTKLPGRHHGYAETLASFEESRRRLGLEYVDLCLVHWPLPRVDKYVDSWKAMIRLRAEGLVRSVGVSDFLPGHLARLDAETGVVPAVNQIEAHPQFPQDDLRARHPEQGIRTMCYSPLGRGTGLLDDATVLAVAEAHQVTPAQVVLRWHVQHGAMPVPRASAGRHQRDNLDVFGFALTEDETNRISSAFPRHRIGFDPETHEEFRLPTWRLGHPPGLRSWPASATTRTSPPPCDLAGAPARSRSGPGTAADRPGRRAPRLIRPAAAGRRGRPAAAREPASASAPGASAGAARSCRAAPPPGVRSAVRARATHRPGRRARRSTRRGLRTALE